VRIVAILAFVFFKGGMFEWLGGHIPVAGLALFNGTRFQEA